MRWFKLRLFGTFEELRSQMEVKFDGAETVFLRTNDGLNIHCYWLPCEDRIQDGPTMILCGPNAECAEQLQFNKDLVELYLKNGINLLTYNYRGFGLSEGVPSPVKLKQDAEIVARYVRKRVG